MSNCRRKVGACAREADRRRVKGEDGRGGKRKGARRATGPAAEKEARKFGVTLGRAVI